MTADPELIVLGAGPAGVAAALSAAEAGVATLIADRAAMAGGQVYRAADPRLSVPGSPEKEKGDELRRGLAASPVVQKFGCKVWNVAAGFRVDAIGPSGPETWRAKALCLALGTTERVVPFSGWTLPGVIGLAAATILLKSQAMLPGHVTLVAGGGPLLGAVASGILKSGGRLAAILDISGRADWLRAAPALMSRPKDLVRGLGWLRDIAMAGVPILSRHAIREIMPDGEGLVVRAGPVDDSGQLLEGTSWSFRVDAVTVGNGLVPSTEASRILGARHRYDRCAGGFVPERDANGRLSIPKLYAAGDGCGVRGAEVARIDGHLAGLAAAFDLGKLDFAAYARRAAPFQRQRRAALRAGRAMAGLMQPPAGLIDAIAPETIVCRCEDVTRSSIELAFDRGAANLDQVKSWSRCGMGPCQGRMCGDTVGALAGARLGGRDKAGFWTARPPLMTLPIEELTGRFDYADIPIPAAAPL